MTSVSWGVSSRAEIIQWEKREIVVDKPIKVLKGGKWGAQKTARAPRDRLLGELGSYKLINGREQRRCMRREFEKLDGKFYEVKI